MTPVSIACCWGGCVITWNLCTLVFLALNWKLLFSINSDLSYIGNPLFKVLLAWAPEFRCEKFFGAYVSDVLRSFASFLLSAETRASSRRKRDELFPYRCREALLWFLVVRQPASGDVSLFSICVWEVVFMARLLWMLSLCGIPICLRLLPRLVILKASKLDLRCRTLRRLFG